LVDLRVADLKRQEARIRASELLRGAKHGELSL
jgi:hypothetical protein